MDVYLGKDRQRATQHLTATHATVTNLTRIVEGFGHKLYMDNFFSFPIWWPDPEKNLLLWDCETKQMGDAKGPKTQDTETQMGWYSGKDQGWTDSCGVEGQERCWHVDKHSRSTQLMQFSGWSYKQYWYNYSCTSGGVHRFTVWYIQSVALHFLFCAVLRAFGNGWSS